MKELLIDITAGDGALVIHHDGTTEVYGDMDPNQPEYLSHAAGYVTMFSFLLKTAAEGDPESLATLRRTQTRMNALGSDA